MSLQAFAANLFPLSTSDVRINVSNDEELTTILEKFTDEQTASSIFDKVGSGKVQLRVFNDYNFQAPNSDDLSKLNDDIGKTHGLKISIFKNLAPALNGNDKYYINISYETNLYTNSNTPKEFQEDYRDVIYMGENGFWQADVYFKEENIFKIIAGKIETKDAYYWKVGGGFHELNADDADRGILLSSLSQQAWYHHLINETNGATYREYNYLPQDASQAGVFIEGELGRDFTLHESQHSRSFVRAGAESRLTMVDKASFVGVYFKVGHDYDPGKNSVLPAFRVMGGINGQQYIKGSYAESFVEVSTQGKYLGAKIKYTVPLTDDPNYLNALPEDFMNRDSLTPGREPTIWLTIEGRLPK